MASLNHEQLMKAALSEAEKAARQEEVPVGAVVATKEGEIIASAGNQTLALNDPTAHAEILAIRRAARAVGNYRLNNLLLYVTLEPCPMCVGAMIWARISTLVFGAWDEKSGACGSVVDILGSGRFNHRFEVVPGILADESAALLRDFFRKRRLHTAGLQEIER